MLSTLTSYQFDDNPVRVVMVLGEPWFVANDVSKVLGYTHAPHMVRHLDEDEKGVHIVDTPGGGQPMTIINESGLYNAIFKSRREEAQRFRKWVTSEVLPELRRNGRFAVRSACRCRIHNGGPGIPDPAPLVDEDIDTARLTAAIGLVREARQVWGPVKTRDIWIKLGLPAPVADAEAIADADEIVDELRRVTEGVASATTEELLTLLMVTPAQRGEFKLRRRVIEGIKLLGWRAIAERRAGVTTKVWTAPRRLASGEA